MSPNFKDCMLRPSVNGPNSIRRPGKLCRAPGHRRAGVDSKLQPMQIAEAAQLQLILTLRSPPPGVHFAVQRGRDALVKPFFATTELVSFAITLMLGPPSAEGSYNFRGPCAQGGPADRFVYVNAGSYAGQMGTPWARRAKIKLAGIPIELVAHAVGKPNTAIEARIEGTMKDGGPVCASVRPPQIAWQIVTRPA